MTHSARKPFSCPHCPKTFIRGDQMRKHAQSKHPDVASTQPSSSLGMVKQEFHTQVKNDGYFSNPIVRQ